MPSRPARTRLSTQRPAALSPDGRLRPQPCPSWELSLSGRGLRGSQGPRRGPAGPPSSSAARRSFCCRAEPCRPVSLTSDGPGPGPGRACREPVAGRAGRRGGLSLEKRARLGLAVRVNLASKLPATAFARKHRFVPERGQQPAAFAVSEDSVGAGLPGPPHCRPPSPAPAKGPSGFPKAAPNPLIFKSLLLRHLSCYLFPRFAVALGS